MTSVILILCFILARAACAPQDLIPVTFLPDEVHSTDGEVPQTTEPLGGAEVPTEAPAEMVTDANIYVSEFTDITQLPNTETSPGAEEFTEIPADMVTETIIYVSEIIDTIQLPNTDTPPGTSVAGHLPETVSAISDLEDSIRVPVVMQAAVGRPGVAVIHQEMSPIIGPEFHYEFLLDNGISESRSGTIGSAGESIMQGSFSIPLGGNKSTVFRYIADENGYRVSSSPQLPAVPDHAYEQVNFAKTQQTNGLVWDQKNHAWL